MGANSVASRASAVFPPLRRDGFLSVAIGCFLALAILYLVPLLTAEQMLAVDNYVGESLLLSLTVLLFGTAAFRSSDATSRTFWWLMTAAFSAWLASQVTDYLIREDAPWLHNFVKDTLLLAMSCLAVIAVDLQPGIIKSSMQTLRARLTALSSVLLIVGVFGYTALVPALAGIHEYTSPFLVYSFLDAYIAVRFLIQGLAAASRGWRTILLLVAGGFALISLADLLVVAFDKGWLEYTPGQPLNLAWYLFYLPLFAASRIEPGRPKIVPRAQRDDWSDSQHLGPILAYSIAIPVVHLTGYGFGLLEAESRMVRDLFVLGWLVAATVGLTWQFLLLRQRLRLAEADKQRAEQESSDLQTQLRQTQRIELVGQLTGGLAHEFGNSLFGAESFAHKILHDARESGDDEREKYALALINALDSSRELVHKFSYLSRGDEVQPLLVDVVDEVRTTLDLLRPGLKSGIRLQFHCEIEDVRAIARKQDLQQIALNLVLNARDAIGDDGFIDVHLGRGKPCAGHCSSCGALITGDQVWLRVSDSGPGVPRDIRHRIFEPLVSSKPPGKGSGLGLSIVHTLVHQLRGHIVLGDAQRSHCSFSVMLPAVQLEVSDGMKAAKGASRRVLVVESDQQLANAIRRNPALHDFHIDHVSSVDAGRVILRHAERELETVLVGDMADPLDVVAIVEAARSSRSRPRVVLCARRQLRSVLANLDGIDQFLEHPVDADVLAATLLDLELA